MTDNRAYPVTITNSGDVTMQYKGDTIMDAGCFYAPYIPISYTPQHSIQPTPIETIEFNVTITYEGIDFDEYLLEERKVELFPLATFDFYKEERKNE